MSKFIHPMALVESDDIGDNTRIWHWSHIMNGVRIGSDCNIGEHCFVESGVIIGDRVTIKNSVSIWNGIEIEDDVFIGPNAVLTNDSRPRSKLYKGIEKIIIRKGASLGANCTIVCGNEIGMYSLIGAGSVVTRSVPDHALIVGNPGRMIGYVCKCSVPVWYFSYEVVNAKINCKCGEKYQIKDNLLV